MAKKGRKIERAAKRGGFKRGFPIWTCPSFFCPFWDKKRFSGIFPICSGMVRGFSRFVLFLFLGLLRAPTRNSPERVRDTIWTFPEKSGKHPGLETPRFSFSQKMENGPRSEMEKNGPTIGKKTGFGVNFSVFYRHFGPFLSHVGLCAIFSIFRPLFSHFRVSARFPFYTKRPDSQEKWCWLQAPL